MAVSEWSHMIHTNEHFIWLCKEQIKTSAVNVCVFHLNLQMKSHLAGRHMSTHFISLVCLFIYLFILHEFNIYRNLEATNNIFQHFSLSLIMQSTQHKHNKKIRTLSSRQMAAVSSSGRGGHGRCPVEIAKGIDWSETLAFRFGFFVSLLSPVAMLSRQQPHVTFRCGCLAKPNWKINLSPMAPQAADVLLYHLFLR